MVIGKKALIPSAHELPFEYFPRGRDAFEHVLRGRGMRGRTVLLPAYIGWGAVEGSGVFDPVGNAKRPHAFYRMRGKLEIDVPSLRRELDAHAKSVLLLIHYFGFKDKNLAKVKKLAAAHDCIVVEDFAHGLFTFLREPIVDFDHAVFSLHKMLPYPSLVGGMLLSRDRPKNLDCYHEFYRYNVEAIARRRGENYEAALQGLLRTPPPGLTILRETLGANVPESFPILLESRDVRNRVHARMNEEGFGLISLYHGLIAEIDESYRPERRISDHITNLPIHQDTNPADVREMIRCLRKVLREARETRG